MQRVWLILFVVCTFGVFTAVAQDSSSAMSQSAPTQNTGAMSNPAQSGSSTLPPQKDSAMSNGATQTGNGTDQQAEGCLVKEQSSYYVQPESGGARMQLSPSRSLDAFVGQHVQVKGHNESGEATATSTGPSSATSDQSSMLTVTGIKVISATCNPSGGTTPQH